MKKILNMTNALADANRLRALALLQGGELCVCKLNALLELAPSTVSKHMAILKQADLVESRRDGKWTHYRLAGREAEPEVAEILGWTLARLVDDPVVRRDRARLQALRAGTEPESRGERC